MLYLPFCHGSACHFHKQLTVYYSMTITNVAITANGQVIINVTPIIYHTVKSGC